MKVSECVDGELCMIDGDEGAGGAADLQDVVCALEIHLSAGAREELLPIHFVCGHIRLV